MRPILLGTPCYRETAALLRDAIESFIDPLVDVVVVDNGSSDECKGVLWTLHDAVRVIRNPENIYVNPAWNQIADEFLRSGSDILVVANADAVMSVGWAVRLLEAARAQPGAMCWRGCGVAERTQLADVAAPATGHSAGVFFALAREAVRRCFPIPGELRIWYGDNWIFELLERAGVEVTVINTIRVWHAQSVSSGQLPGIQEMCNSDNRAWSSYVGQMCNRAADADVRGSKMDELEQRYIAMRDTPSDINEHLPTLRAYAERCEHVTEFGVGRSSWALAHARPKVLRCYDPAPDSGREFSTDLPRLAAAGGTDMRFTRVSDLEVTIESTDLLFIDSLHTYKHLSQELAMHAGRVRQYILLHDTETFGSVGEDGGLGLMAAVNDFLALSLDWTMVDRYRNNNGLTVLKRCAVRPVTEDISALFAKYGTDKRSCGYGHIYHALLYARRELIKNVLEIGIGAMNYMGHAAAHYRPGGSLRAWRDYFPNAAVLGLDTAQETLFEEERITTGLCDSTDAQSVAKALGDRRFDFIVDDGSHHPDHQMATLRNVYPRLNRGGVYIIEDIPLGSILSAEPKRIHDILGHNEFFFAGAGGHCLVIFNQPMSPYTRTGY